MYMYHKNQSTYYTYIWNKNNTDLKTYPIRNVGLSFKIIVLL